MSNTETKLPDLIKDYPPVVKRIPARPVQSPTPAVPGEAPGGVPAAPLKLPEPARK